MNFSDEVARAARKVKLLVMDCDGVLTDGRLYYSETGEALKVFDVKDGQGIVSWIDAGNHCAIITARNSGALSRRAEELGVDYVSQSAGDKGEELRRAAEHYRVGLDQVAYIGDDIGDLPAMRLCGYPIAVGDSASEAKSAAVFVTSSFGGRGAVREAVNLLFAVRELEVGSTG